MKTPRSRDHRILGGVLGGYATDRGWNLIATRIVFLALVLVPGSSIDSYSLPGPFGFISALALIWYVAAWMMMPKPETSLTAAPIAGVPVRVAPPRTPAGWYPDPSGQHGDRWFDGAMWTEQVRSGASAPH